MGASHSNKSIKPVENPKPVKNPLAKFTGLFHIPNSMYRRAGCVFVRVSYCRDEIGNSHCLVLDEYTWTENLQEYTGTYKSTEQIIHRVEKLLDLLGLFNKKAREYAEKYKMKYTEMSEPDFNNYISSFQNEENAKLQQFGQIMHEKQTHEYRMSNDLEYRLEHEKSEEERNWITYQETHNALENIKIRDEELRKIKEQELVEENNRRSRRIETHVVHQHTHINNSTNNSTTSSATALLLGAMALGGMGRHH